MKLKKKKFFIIDVLGLSDGKANQTFKYSILPEGLWIRESQREIVRRWQLVKNFSESDNSDGHYVIDKETGQVRFGDGINGRIPKAGSVIKATYGTGGGIEGNLRTGFAIIVVRGTDEKYIGKYLVESVSHLINSNGYATIFKIKRVKDEPPSLQQSNYFYGKLLTAEDFSNEQQYFVEKKPLIDKLIIEWQRESCLIPNIFQIMKCLGWKIKGTIKVSVISNKKVIIEKEPLIEKILPRFILSILNAFRSFFHLNPKNVNSKFHA